MKILLTYLFTHLVFCLLLIPQASGDEYSLRALYKTPLPAGSATSGNIELQEPASNITGYQTEFLYTFDSPSIFLGCGYLFEKREYYLWENANRRFKIYKSRYKSFYLTTGYVFKPNDNWRAELGIRLGYGNMYFSKNGVGEKQVSDIFSTGIDAKVVRTFALKYFKIDVIGGLGIQKIFVPSFYYDNRNFLSSEFGIGGNLLLGVGISF